MKIVFDQLQLCKINVPISLNVFPLIKEQHYSQKFNIFENLQSANIYKTKTRKAHKQKIVAQERKLVVHNGKLFNPISYAKMLAKIAIKYHFINCLIRNIKINSTD